MKCWNCGADLEDPFGKISFRETCQKCHAALHCCKNCIYYKPGQPNDCLVPNTDYVSERTAINFCEEFKLKGKGPEVKVNPDDVAKRLFGDSDEEPPQDPKDKFGSLFK